MGLIGGFRPEGQRGVVDNQTTSRATSKESGLRFELSGCMKLEQPNYSSQKASTN